jgi:predicted enzyme related to lactoylglutathione lyase
MLAHTSIRCEAFAPALHPLISRVEPTGSRGGTKAAVKGHGFFRRQRSDPRWCGWNDSDVEVLSSRILVRPADLRRSRRFYSELLGLAIYREFGPPTDPGMVFFLGPGLLEVSGRSAGAVGHSVMLWLQVRDVHAEHARLAAAGVRILREPTAEPWGLTEMWIEDPDGVRIVLVEVPPDHPLRRDPRSS